MSLPGEHRLDTPKTYPLLSNSTYDGLKKTATIILPGLGTLYFALAAIWGLPHADEIVGTIAAVNVFVGLVLGLSTKTYNNSDAKYDGTIDVTKTDDVKTFALNLHSDPDQLDQQKAVTFKVNANEDLPIT